MDVDRTKVNKFGLLTYQTGQRIFNVGDYIQSLAARQFLPSVDTYINREAMHLYDGEPVKVILNGWFLHHPGNWPPSKNIIPLFISFHLSPEAGVLLEDSGNIEYFKQHEPIGCRDHFTLSLFRKKDIEAYFSGCLTMTLKKNTEEVQGEKVISTDVFDPLFCRNVLKRTVSPFIDLDSFRKIPFFTRRTMDQWKNHRYMFKLLSRLVGKEVLKTRTDVFHMQMATMTEEERFEYAEELLKLYAAAKLVITTRLHCALPCIAMGTPVIMIRREQDSLFNTSRFDGLTDEVNTLFVPKNLKLAPDLSRFNQEFITTRSNESLVSLLIQKINEFINK